VADEYSTTYEPIFPGQTIKKSFSTHRRFHSVTGVTEPNALAHWGHRGCCGKAPTSPADTNPAPTNPKIALITLSATERPSKIDQAKSASAHNENTSTTPLLLKLRPRCCFVSFMSKDYAASQLAKGVLATLRLSFARQSERKAQAGANAIFCQLTSALIPDCR
jgi:hypothetical protein